ncbi:epithelial cell-transforming sequence 2 oncogene-like isoform X1 [Larimichthys crocea]|uniref:epithelial cell-transforming sequence 2 oncogene-like isoform X1 n=2 Tax=Larimichthys crocea TaxID=215358 RepID=UPI000F5E6FA7|nr:epithelial cell-transforming sequence 2 oncogene-like isoform X1 [Larimichthys crocea]XP_019128770.2 epithelial cell-transforming sequence 2 oncogene-like isoform X1 [Larimichthys crocea]XP_019128771.2 epithelial cell-transforming sequence 2 oncogene-like isoform X1 [Larimichthys crocea]XP_027147653.1 epithelial cell-transforming sequence 2 oncogene-like isoform X1 [Larimichthys crocea]XP_027147655.1 epithelial cell-transforming sequence 2 oncogene-like isoform X1 [Larimichthys crocea]XP_02
MDTKLKSTSHSVKRWQLSGTDYSARAETLFSTWTPLNDKTGNMQLFEERMNLVLHWFDLWTDRQRKHLLYSLLTRCTKPQLRYCRDLLIETLPVTQVDFTSVLPRFLSLYVMSFLSPRDLCSASQVSWHWRVLTEQDCLWAGRCIRRGWFLPYTPVEKEYGAWKNHYVSCVSTLDLLTPREAAEQYGTLNRPSTGATEEEEERRKERRVRQMIRDKLQEEKRTSIRTRRAWGGGGSTQTGRPGSGLTFSSSPSLSWPPRTAASSSLSLSLDSPRTAAPSSDRVQTSSPRSERLKASGALSSFTYRPAPPHTAPPIHRPSPALLLLISDRIPAYELLLCGVKAGVIVVLYDHRGTLSALLTQAERAISGQRVQRLGLVAPGGTDEIQLLHSSFLSERTLLTPDHRDFWEKLSGWVAPAEDGGGIDMFSPLAASASGVALVQTLSTLTGLEVRAPTGLATGSFQNILSEWSGGAVCSGLSDQQPAAPALRFMCESVLRGWCTQAQWMEEALREMRGRLGAQLQRVSLQARGRALGHCLWENVCLEELCVSEDLKEALTEGLTALTRQDETRPLEFLAVFLTRWSEEKGGGGEGQWKNKGGDLSVAAHNSQKRLSRIPDLPQEVLDWRGAVARELHHSECVYVGRLGAVLKVYQEPLTAALNSNRAILSHADIHIVLSPVMHILELNRVFQVDLQARLQQWDAEQCVGDVFVKLCSKLRVYTNYLNNYTTALCTIDKCREAKPAFRAFLKRADRTLATHMLSLQELLLCPVWRIQEYVTLLQALSVHTQPGHPDHTHLSSALNTLLRFIAFIQKLKRSSERDGALEETQQMIQGCPRLSESNRQLIITQDAALLRSPDEQIPDSFRTYEQVSDVSFFLFNDALVLTRRTVQHTPFTLAHQSAHTFVASVALASLTVREITHSRYVSHAFVLEGPCRSWVCATERGEEREHFLSVLRSAITSALRGHE